MFRLTETVLAHPKTRGLDLDSPDTTLLRRQIILEKPFLKEVYEEWYGKIAAAVPEGEGSVLEIGAGGGFLETVLPAAVTSEVFHVPGVGLVADAQRLPFAESSLKAIVMTNVLHHLPNSPEFFSEAAHALRPGGRIIMIEPWNTSWSRFVHERFHSELMAPGESEWEFPDAGPLSGANAALAWMVVERDRSRLEREWPFRVGTVELLMPFRYLVSGGVSLRSLQPRWMYPVWSWLDNRTWIKNRMSVFAFIQVERVG